MLKVSEVGLISVCVQFAGSHPKTYVAASHRPVSHVLVNPHNHFPVNSGHYLTAGIFGVCVPLIQAKLVYQPLFSDPRRLHTINAMGIEPMTSFLPRMRSTTELRGPIHNGRLLCKLMSGPGRTRTCEGVRQRIYSPSPLPLGTLTLMMMQFQATGGCGLQANNGT